MAERIIPSPNTLVKYDNPVLVTKHEVRAGPSGVRIHFVAFAIKRNIDFLFSFLKISQALNFNRYLIFFQG